MDNKIPPDAETFDGSAALSICESLLLALTDLKVISEAQTRELLNDVVTAHTEAAVSSKTPEQNRGVIAIVQRILAGKNSVPH